MPKKKTVKVPKNASWYKLRCVACRKVWTEKQTTTRCLSCGDSLDVIYDFKTLRKRVDLSIFQKKHSDCRAFDALYPFDTTPEYVTLGEGHTPLIKTKNLGKMLGLKNLYMKNEGENLTGAFKDRGSMIEITKAKTLGALAVAVASTGNMAASVSAYASAGNLPCFVFVPEGTPSGKLAQSLAYGARVISIRGSYNDCVKMCELTAKNQGYYLAGDYAFRGEGYKTIAYEIFEQLGNSTPDFMIVPTGCGTNIAGIYKGWKDLKGLGLIKKLPRMVAVQPETVPTIVNAWKKGLKDSIVVEPAKSIASAVGISSPLDGRKALSTLYESDGLGVVVPENKILEAQYELSNKESLFVEPSSALTLAAIKILKKEGKIKTTNVVVGVLTGVGLKDPHSILTLIPKPHVLEPDIEEIKKYFKQKLYTMRAPGMLSKEIVLWSGIPKQNQVIAHVKKEFNIELQNGYLLEAMEQVRSFHEKMEKMKRADLQYIIESVLKQSYGQEVVLRIKDFEVHINQHKKPLAWVQLYFQGTIYENHSTGVGPVDAILEAISKMLSARDNLQASLTNYKVEISTGGTDAVVAIEMTLKSQSGTEVIGSATSPDVIVASVTAFEKAYNALHYKELNKHQ